MRFSLQVRKDVNKLHEYEMGLWRNLIAAFRAHYTGAPLNFSCYIIYTVTIGRHYQQLIHINTMSDENKTPEEVTETTPVEEITETPAEESTDTSVNDEDTE